MRVAVLTPLPPARTGVAHYASMLLPALAERVSVRAFDTLEGYRRDEYDAVIYQLGNNPHHEIAYAEAMREPGVIVLHDLVLHHLIVEMTLARGDAVGYVAALEANHGPAGAAWARGRAAGLHSEMGNFLLPASVDVAKRSRAVIVHNQYAADRLRSFGVETPIHVVPHPYVPARRAFDGDAIRARFGLGRSHRVIGFFGFLTSAKRAEVVLEAFRIARARDARLVLLVVGQPAPNMPEIEEEGVITTGYVADDEFPAFYAAADRLVNLRYPTAGETSGTLIRALDAGKPVCVSDYAQFAEFPDDCVVKVPLGAGEVEALVSFFLDELEDPSAAQREWLEANARIGLTVDGYLRALQGRRDGARSAGETPAFLFPRLELVRATTDTIVLRNIGDSVIRTRTYGEPEYRLIANGEWLALPRDLGPGETAEIAYRGTRGTLRLYHALQGIPMLEPEAFASADV